MAKSLFKLHATTQVQGEGRLEDAYTYVSEDGKQGVQFRWHSKHAFVPVVLNKQDMDDAKFKKLIRSFMTAGVNQHDFDGGYAEAIQTLSV